MSRLTFKNAGSSSDAQAPSAYALLPAARASLRTALTLCGIGLVVIVLLAGCGSASKAAPVSKALPIPTAVPTLPTVAPTLAPETLAQARALIVKMGCVGCHTIDAFSEARGMIGPNLTHVFSSAGALIASKEYKASGGQATSPREYLRESILSPGTYLAQDCPTGPCPDYVMPRSFKKQLTPEDLEALLDLLSSPGLADPS